MKPLVYRGSKEICGVVGLNWQKIADYVDEYNLPAFKIDGLKTWYATHEDLEGWVADMRKQYLIEK